MEWWKDKKVIVTGGAGFLGQYVVKELEDKGAEVFVSRSADFNLRYLEDAHRAFVAAGGPNLVIHLAADVGGIGYNQQYPGTLFYNNMQMGLNVLECAREFGVEKFVGIGTVCCYPKFTPVPFKEEDLWNGYPEETNAPYGLAKKMLLVQEQAYRKQFGLNSIFLIPTNLYGPGDKFDPSQSHVIPALIKKFIEAEDEVVIWGTGKATREFLFVEDCAKAIVMATEHYNHEDPVNIGTGEEVSIRDLAEEIARLTNFKGKILWDTSKPDGQPRRCLDVSKAEKYFGFKAKTNLFYFGLERTVEWYMECIK